MPTRQIQLPCAGADTTTVAQLAVTAAAPPRMSTVRRSASTCARARNTIASPTTAAKTAPLASDARSTEPRAAAPADPNTSPLNVWCAVIARDVGRQRSSSARSAEFDIAGANPAAAIDNLAATPRVARDRVASTAPIVVMGDIQPTAQADAALVKADSVASAVKQIAPQRVIRRSRNDVEHATAAPSKELAVDGP